MKSQIHFAHANGFPSAAYQALFEPLERHYRLSNIPLLGHDPKYPVTNNWTHLLDQLIESVETKASEPVIGLGHSLGGALTLMAAVKRPELFKAVVLLDVPTFNRFESLFIFAAKNAGFIDRVTPARKSKTRRTQWASKEEAFAYFKSRSLFENFDERCLWDYINNVLQTNSEGTCDLSYRLDVELAIYRTLPHTLVYDRSMLAVPLAVIAGRESNMIQKHQYLRMKNKLGFHGLRVPGSHMFPFEYPDEAAQHIRRILQRQGIT